MANMASGEPSRHGLHEGSHKISQDKPGENGGGWYFSRKEIEENSPSRRDGIDLKKETYLQKSYCTFLQDLGMRLKVPQMTIATAIIFCHRFFLRQSHARNDRRTIATVCMFLAGKVEETPRPLRDVILVSWEIIHKRDAAAAQRIKQREVYEQQKELILLGERVVLTTLGFDLNVHHPYKPLVEAIKKFEVAQGTLAQVAWNFVNDGLRTSLCLQFKPHHIAAGAIFLGAKFLGVKLPTEPQKSWWQVFDVTPRQLEDVSNQMLELYEQTKVQPSQPSEAEGSAGTSRRLPSKGAANTEHGTSNSSSHGGVTLKTSSSKPAPSRPLHDQSRSENLSGPPRPVQTRNNDYGGSETNSITHHEGDEIDEPLHDNREALPDQANSEKIQNTSRFRTGGHYKDDQEGNSRRMDTGDTVEPKDNSQGKHSSHKDGSPQNAPKKLDKDKIKAAFERRKALGELTRKMDPVDELERELEDVEVPVSEKFKHERKQNLAEPLNRPETKICSDLVEEGEVQPFDDADTGYQSPSSNSCKRKAGSAMEKPEERKQRKFYHSSSEEQNHHDSLEDRNE